MMYVGIDNGLDGGVVVLDKNSYIVAAEPMPVTKLGKGREVNVLGLKELLPPAGTSATIVVEEASKHSAGTLALCSTWYTYGHILAVLKLLGYRYQTVRPRSWQRTFWVKPKMAQGIKFNTKAAALQAATRLWPEQDWTATERSTKPHDGIVDAALIAEYARKNL